MLVTLLECIPTGPGIGWHPPATTTTSAVGYWKTGSKTADDWEGCRSAAVARPGADVPEEAGPTRHLPRRGRRPATQVGRSCPIDRASVTSSRGSSAVLDRGRVPGRDHAVEVSQDTGPPRPGSRRTARQGRHRDIASSACPDRGGLLRQGRGDPQLQLDRLLPDRVQPRSPCGRRRGERGGSASRRTAGSTTCITPGRCSTGPCS